MLLESSAATSGGRRREEVSDLLNRLHLATEEDVVVDSDDEGEGETVLGVVLDRQGALAEADIRQFHN